MTIFCVHLLIYPRICIGGLFILVVAIAINTNLSRPILEFPSIVTGRGGLPNVLMEAQLCGLAAVSTAISAIPELITDGLNGKLVPERDPKSLSLAMAELIANPALRDQMGRKGNEIVRRDFSFYTGMKELAHRFGVDAPAAGAAAQQPAAE